MSDTLETLKAELAEVDAKIRGIKVELGKANETQREIIDRLFEAETGFCIGGDAIQTPTYGKKTPRRVKILRITDREWSNDWWCKVKIYKKDGTLGKNETQVFSVKDELKQVED